MTEPVMRVHAVVTEPVEGTTVTTGFPSTGAQPAGPVSLNSGIYLLKLSSLREAQ